MTSSVRSVLIAGGGTGGHVFPMVAVGDALRALVPDLAVTYVGTARGLEQRICGERGDRLELLDVAPLRGGGALGFAKGLATAAKIMPAARDLVRRIDPQIALSVGGYAGGPVALAARMLGVPVAILEPNSVLGLTNKLLSPIAVRAYTAFPETERFLRPSVVRRLGVPLRRAFSQIPYDPPSAGTALRVLVIGGSQGARFFNETMPAALRAALDLARSKGFRLDLDVIHQCGKDADEVRGRYESAGVTSGIEVTSFLPDVASALGRAHLVIARCGASSCAELCAVGRPGIFIPFPFAADNHQWRNAKSLADAGAVVALAQAEAKPEAIAAAIVQLFLDPGRLSKMAIAAAGQGKPTAATDIAADLLGVARSRAVTEEAA